MFKIARFQNQAQITAVDVRALRSTLVVDGNNITARRLKTNENAYTETLENALLTFYEMPNFIAAMQRRAMQKDFSWDVPNGSLDKYYTLLKTGHL